jgi:DNA polymerase elongation subunit (family B)
VIHSRTDWGAEVVYGDTDSLFVYLRGRSRDEAFDIGEDIANTITQMNPKPIKLKFEKVSSQLIFSDRGLPPMRVACEEEVCWI